MLRALSGTVKANKKHLGAQPGHKSETVHASAKVTIEQNMNMTSHMRLMNGIILMTLNEP